MFANFAVILIAAIAIGSLKSWTTLQHAVLVILTFILYKLIRSIYVWKISPLNKIPGPPRDDWWIGYAQLVFAEPMFKSEERWRKQAKADAMEKAKQLRDLKKDICQSDRIETEIPLIAYSTIFGTWAVTVFDADVIKEILMDTSYSASAPRFLKRYAALRSRLGDGLLSSEGALWARHRRIIQPSFQTRLLERKLDTVVPAITSKLIEKWRKASHKTIDLDSHLSALALDVLGHSAFSHDFDTLSVLDDWITREELVCENYTNFTKEEINQLGAIDLTDSFIKAAKVSMKPSLLTLVSRIFSVEFPERYFSRKLSDARNCMDSIADNMIQQAREKSDNHESANSVDDGKSLLQLLLKAADASVESNDASDRSRRNTLSPHELRTEIKTFVLAGHDTTATWCYWAMYALAIHESEQEKVYQDILEQCRSFPPDELIGLEQAERMDYFAAFLNEVLRLYPPAPFISRMTSKEENFKGYVIPTETRVVIPVLLLHRDQTHWGSDAENFRPERWLDAKRNEKRHACSFLPFSLGLRNCVGQRFARMEAKLILANIIREFVIKLAPCMPNEIAFDSFVTLKSKPRVKICVSERRR